VGVVNGGEEMPKNPRKNDKVDEARGSKRKLKEQKKPGCQGGGKGDHKKKN